MDLAAFDALGLDGVRAFGALLLACGAASYAGADIMSSAALGFTKRRNSAGTQLAIRLASVIIGVLVAVWIAGPGPLAVVAGGVSGVFNVAAMRIGAQLMRKTKIRVTLEEAALRAVTRNHAGASIVMDAKGVIIQGGGDLLLAASIDPDKIIGAPGEKVLSFGGDRLALAIRRALNGRLQHSTFDFNGTSYTVWCNPISDPESGQVVGCAVVTELTELIEARDELLLRAAEGAPVVHLHRRAVAE